MALVPEVVGAPTIQGAVIAIVNNRPNGSPDDRPDPGGVKAPKDKWYIPSHCPVFQSQEGADRHGVRYVTAHAPRFGGPVWARKVAGVSLDGQYNVEQLRANAGVEGQTQLSIAVGGLATVMSTPEDNNKFTYGDVVRITGVAPVERLLETAFQGPLSYNLVPANAPSLGTFVGPVGPEGGMRVMLNFDL